MTVQKLEGTMMIRCQISNEIVMQVQRWCIVCTVLLYCNCFIFSSYQSAKMIRNAEMAVIPSGGVADHTDFSDYNVIQVPVGCSFGVGVNRWDA